MSKSPVVVTKEEKEKVGSCTFCPSTDYRKVYQLSGGNVLVRICHHCFDKIRRDINALQKK
jgi:hypothetical protein